MNISLFQIMAAMLAGILVIILFTTNFRFPAFFALLLACFLTGLLLQMPLPDIVNTAKTGFGHIMQSLGFIIVLGTTLGILLEKTGCTQVIAAFILNKVGNKNAPLAIALTGFIVGLPVFCDSGYIVLSGLNHSMIRKTRKSPVAMSVSLASGLYVVHCLLPPHPGAAAAAETIGVDFGKLIIFGIIIAFPVMLLGHAWSKFIGKRVSAGIENANEIQADLENKPSVGKAFLPVIIPIVLIALRSFLLAELKEPSALVKNLLALGDPVMALLIGVLLAVLAKRKWTKSEWSHLLTDSIEKAGPILLIIGGGGAFGAILAATNIGDHLVATPGLTNLGILLPFVVAFTLKTAQGSSTVAIITTASIILPLLDPLGLNSENGKLLAVLAMGAGSMMISHANDAFFWVIANFSGFNTRTMLKVYTPVTIIMGLTTLVLIWLLSFFIL